MNIKTILTWFFAGLAFMVGIALASPSGSNQTPTASPTTDTQVLVSPSPTQTLTPSPTSTPTTTPTVIPTSISTASPTSKPAPKPTATPESKPVPTATPKPTSNCDPNYEWACVPIASDVDCLGGSGNGPAYVKGPVHVIGRDIYGLDRDGDGIACEK